MKPLITAEHVKEPRKVVLNADYEFTELGIRNPRKIKILKAQILNKIDELVL